MTTTTTSDLLVGICSHCGETIQRGPAQGQRAWRHVQTGEGLCASRESCADPAPPRGAFSTVERATVKTGNAGGTRPLVWASCRSCGWFGSDDSRTTRATAEAEADRHNAKAHR